jgi:lipoprotein signal peptidase
MPEAEAAPNRPGRTGHPRIAAVLVVVGTLLTFIAIFSIWINRQALNTDNWVNTSSKLLQNADVQSQLSIFLADQLTANVDVQAELAKALPPRLAPLAGPAAGALNQLAPQVAQRALATPQVQTLWSAANRAAHETFLKIVDGGGSTVSTNGGQVTLDLGTLVAQIGGQLGVGANLASKIPADAGQVTILRSDQLSAAQSIASLIRRLPIVLTLLVIVLYGFAIYLARGRRRKELRSVGFAFIVAGALALIVRSLAGTAVVDGLAHTEAVKPAVQAVWSIGTSLLVTVASSAIAFGVLVVIGAWLAGPTRPATALRRQIAPYAGENRGAVYAGAGVVLVALIAWAPIAALRKPVGILLFLLLFAVGTEILRRQILREFPDARAGEREGWRLPSAFGGPQPAPAAGPGGGPPQTVSTEDAKLERLERVTALHDRGGLTDEEFAKAKAGIFSDGGAGGA